MKDCRNCMWVNMKSTQEPCNTCNYQEDGTFSSWASTPEDFWREKEESTRSKHQAYLVDPTGAQPPTPWPFPKSDPRSDPPESPLDVQVGGTHYKGCKIQPIEYIHANEMNYCEANVVKYITRWRDKGGKKDLEKVKHYVDLLIQLEGL